MMETLFSADTANALSALSKESLAKEKVQFDLEQHVLIPLIKNAASLGASKICLTKELILDQLAGSDSLYSYKSIYCGLRAMTPYDIFFKLIKPILDKANQTAKANDYIYDCANTVNDDGSINYDEAIISWETRKFAKKFKR